MKIYLPNWAKDVISVSLMLTIFPFITLAAMNAGHGGTEKLTLIFFMWIFGVLVPNPFWLTGIPAVIAIPLLFRRLAPRPFFRERSTWLIVLYSALTGALFGAVIMLPMTIIMLINAFKHAATGGIIKPTEWLMTLTLLPPGAIGGFFTLPVISLLYRIPAKPVAPPAALAIQAKTETRP